MSNYIAKAAAYARLIKLARAAPLIRRQRELQKYAQAVQMQKYALSDMASAGFGAGVGGLLGGGLGYALGGKDKKLLSTLLGAGIGAGVGGLGGYGLNKYVPSKKPELTALRGVVGSSGDPGEFMPVPNVPVLPGETGSPEEWAAYFQAAMGNLQATHFNAMNKHRRDVAALGDPLKYTPEAQKQLRALNDAYSAQTDAYTQGMASLRAKAKAQGVLDKLN